MAKPIQIVIGSGGDYDPGAGETQFSIPSLAGAEYYVSRPGVGIMPYSTYEDLPAGGFTLLGGLETSMDEVWFVTIVEPGSSTASGNYSNGYNVPAVIAALENRIGFRQPTGTGVPTLTSAVTTSNSGRYYQDFHSLLTVENIKATMPQAGASDAQLITYLQNQRKAVLLRCLNGVFNDAQVIDQPQFVYQRYGINDTLEPNAGKFTGIRIEVANTPDAAVQLDSVQLYFDTDVTFNLYLFKDGIPVPFWSLEVTAEANTLTDVTLSEKVLKRGLYYLGYFQDDIGSAKAYRQQICEEIEPAYFSAKSMQADATGATTFNRNEISYPAQPVGLNAEISSFKDYTTAIKRKAAMFDELVGLTMAYSVIEQTIYAVRSNVNERILKDQLDKIGLQLDLNGVAPISDSPHVTGLKQRIERELKRVKQSFYPKAKAITVEL